MMAASKETPSSARRRIASESSFDRAFRHGLRILARKSCSVARLREGLEKRRFPPADVFRVIQKFRKLGYLDDLRLATEYLRNRSERKLIGRHRLVRDLRRFAIPETILREAVRRFRQEVDEGKILDRALRKWLRSRGPLESASEVRRLFQYLLRRGFETEAIQEVVRLHLSEGDPAERGGEEGEGR